MLGVNANGNPVTLDLLCETALLRKIQHFTFEEPLGDLGDGKYDRNDEALKPIRADLAEGQRR